jgi:hypothetical protein
MEMRVAKSQTESQQTIAARNATIAQVKQYADEKNWPALAKMLQTFEGLSRASNSTSRLDAKFSDVVDETYSKVVDAERSMRVWYIFGTAALLLSTVLSNVLLERSFQRLERQMPSKKGK